MKIKLTALLIVILAILGAALYLRYAGVTHERIVEVVEDRYSLNFSNSRVGNHGGGKYDIIFSEKQTIATGIQI